MGKIARRGAAAGAAALAGALAFSTAASADIDGGPINIDGDPDVVTSQAPWIYRFADEDRVGTALQAAQRTDIVDTDSGWGETVIIATADEYADALAATTLADLEDAPVLLNNSGNSLRGDVLNYVTNNFENAILVGGTNVFGMGVVNQLENGLDGEVDRIEGANRYQTAIQLALATIEHPDFSEDGSDTVNVFLASGTDFADALTSGAAAAANNGVVLLTNGWDRIDRFTYEALTIGGLQDHESIFAVGGPAAAAAAAGHQGDPIETNYDVIGDDRYETAVEVADEWIIPHMENVDYDEGSNFVVASGENFPDAVVGGAYAANVDGALLLTREVGLTNATADFFEDVRLDVQNVVVFGGPDSVAPVVSQQLADLNWRY